MVRPTATDVTTWSLVDFADKGVDDDMLAVEVTRACDYVERVTGQTFAAMPSTYESLAQEATQLRTEQTAFHRQEEHAETASDELIASFSAGSYTEQKQDPGVFRKAMMVNPWPRLNDLLWLLMTDDMRDWWREQLDPNFQAPAFEVTEVDWSEGGMGDVLDAWGA